MANKLTNYNFDTSYVDKDKIQKFYSDILSCSKTYKRVSAYFTTGIFTYLSKGLKEFINSQGYMQLILSPEVDEKTIDAINKGYSLKKYDFKNNFPKEIMQELDSIYKQEDYSIFAYLIAIGKLDIKMVIKPKGIFHHKFGCVSDGINNLIFVGSINSTKAAVDDNDESFQVTIDWDEPSKRDLQSIDEFNVLFDKYWNNEYDGSLTVELPDDLIDKMIKGINEEEIKRIKHNINYFRFDLDENKNVIITSNKNLNEIFDRRSLGVYYSFVDYSSNNKFIFSNIINNEDLFNFSVYLSKIAKDNNIEFYYSRKSNDFFKTHIRDYKLLYKRGLEIKREDFINSDEFRNYKLSINNLLKRSLVDQQVVSAIHFIELKRSLNFSVPGSGKTASVLGAFEYLNSLPYTNENHVEKIVVFGPLNSIKSWKDEYGFVSSHSNEHIPLDITTCGMTNDKIDILKHDYKNARLILINYDIIPQLEEALCELINDKVLVVFDEIHRIKNLVSPKYESLLKIIDNVQYRIALTGTPLPNGYIDLYNIISLLHDDYTEKYFNMYKNELKKHDSLFRKIGVQNSELNKKLFPFYIRVTKKDLNVPRPEPDHVIKVIANNYEISLFNEIKDTNKESFDRIIKQVKIGCVPFSINNEVDESFYKSINKENYKKFMTSKLYDFIRIFKENNRKSVVWCEYIPTIKLVSKLLEVNGFNVAIIYGDTPQEERDKLINQFNYSDSIDAIVTNPATLAESVSLHKSCHDAHYLELNYNLYEYLQSRDRIHRLGLKPTDKTNYYIYINFYDYECKKSIDYKIYLSLLKKRDMMLNSIEKGNFTFGYNSNIDFQKLDHEVNNDETIS